MQLRNKNKIYLNGTDIYNFNQHGVKRTDNDEKMSSGGDLWLVFIAALDQTFLNLEPLFLEAMLESKFRKTFFYKKI